MRHVKLNATQIAHLIAVLHLDIAATRQLSSITKDESELHAINRWINQSYRLIDLLTHKGEEHDPQSPGDPTWPSSDIPDCGRQRPPLPRLPA